MVAEVGHLTRAAKRLHASQPAVSAHIKTLEEELGVSLFLRTPKGMILTRDGRQLKTHADKALAIIDDMLDQAAERRNTLTGDIRIGINTEPGSLRISELFPAMQEQYPHLHIHLLQSMTGEVLNKLEDGTLDAGFMYGENSSDKIFSTELQRLRLVVAGPGAWRDRFAGAGIQELAGFPWILTPADCPFHTVTSQLFARHNLQPSEVALVNQESTIKAMVEAGVGVSLMLEQDAMHIASENRFAIWRQEDLSMKLSIACLVKRKDEIKILALREVLGRIWDSPGNP